MKFLLILITLFTFNFSAFGFEQKPRIDVDFDITVYDNPSDQINFYGNYQDLFDKLREISVSSGVFTEILNKNGKTVASTPNQDLKFIKLEGSAKSPPKSNLRFYGNAQLRSIRTTKDGFRAAFTGDSAKTLFNIIYEARNNFDYIQNRGKSYSVVIDDESSNRSFSCVNGYDGANYICYIIVTEK